MGLMDKLSNRVTNRVEDNIARSVDKSVDKAMDTQAIQRKREEQKIKKEEKKALEEESRSYGSQDAFSDRKQCECGFVTKENFCSKCGANLSETEYMTHEELDECINR